MATTTIGCGPRSARRSAAFIGVALQAAGALTGDTDDGSLITNVFRLTMALAGLHGVSWWRSALAVLGAQVLLAISVQLLLLGLHQDGAGHWRPLLHVAYQPRQMTIPSRRAATHCPRDRCRGTLRP